MLLILKVAIFMACNLSAAARKPIADTCPARSKGERLGGVSPIGRCGLHAYQTSGITRHAPVVICVVLEQDHPAVVLRQLPAAMLQAQADRVRRAACGQVGRSAPTAPVVGYWQDV
jgi:hypothetical protein